MTVWPRPVVLAVLDGVGLREETEANAIEQADTPTLDRLMDQYPMTTLTAHGTAVGLPEDALGGSEVGHMQLGAGRLVKETPKRIDEAIEDGSFFDKGEMDQAFQHAEQNNGRIHFIGLCSDAYVHSHIEHLHALLKASESYDVTPVIHPVLDGRDTGPRSAERYLSMLQDWCDQYDASIGAMMGRYYGMDRDENWERTERAYRAIVDGDVPVHDSIIAALETSYDDDTSDEFVEPVQIDEVTVESGDALIMFNFRADRARQLTAAFLQHDKTPVGHAIADLHIATMAQYDDDFDAPVLFERHTVDGTLGAWLAEHDIPQLRVAESEKRAHVTYFFNGREEDPYPLEDRQIFESPDVPTYDETPAMRAEAITDRVCDAIEDGKNGFILANFSNADMIGHTGNLEAAIEAVEVVDACLEKLHAAVEETPFTLIVTADHGNADDMSGEMETSHTKNPVPLIVCTDRDVSFSDGDGLYQIGPSILAMNEHVSSVMGEPLFSLDHSEG